MIRPRDPAFLGRLLGWLEGGLARGRSERLALSTSPLKLLRFPDSPDQGYTTWCTFESSLRTWRGPDVQVGYELVFSAKGDVDGLTALRRATDTLAAVGRPPQPGGVVLDLLVGLRGLPPALRHAVFVPPWLEPPLDPFVDGDHRVEARYVVPVSESEVELIRTSGFDALAALWERTLAPLFDPGRPTEA